MKKESGKYMKDTIRIVILSRDRPKYLKDTIDSVLNQKPSMAKIKIVISDNSEKDEVEEMINLNYSNDNLNYIRRVPTVSVLKHGQLVISECEEKYIVIFHDDDIMHPDYVKTMLPFIKKEGVVAVGCNAFLFTNDLKKTVPSKSFSFEKVKTFSNEKEFLREYIPSSSGIAAFPGYMYNTECLKKIELDNVHRKDGGSDVLMLNSLLNHGSIIWTPNFLMYYRLHGSNDGNNLYTADYIVILNRMSYNGLGKDTDALSMRFIYLLRWFVAQDIKNLFLWKNRIVFRYLFVKSFVLLFRADSWKILLNNQYVKRFFIK
jgi:cellulose synthase/poly-beta-1,6-N-acetylglucosamine synthase-like glycosyltransferase